MEPWPAPPRTAKRRGWRSHTSGDRRGVVGTDGALDGGAGQGMPGSLRDSLVQDRTSVRRCSHIMGVRLHCSDPGAVVADGGRPRHDAQSIPTAPRPPQASRCDSAHLHLRIHPRICDLVGGLSLRVCQVATVLYTIHSGFSEAAPLLRSTAHRAARTSRSLQLRSTVHRRLSSREPSQMCASRMSLTLSQCHILIYFHTREVCIVKTTVSSTLVHYCG